MATADSARDPSADSAALDPSRQRVLILGCGGLGGIIASSLFERDQMSAGAGPSASAGAGISAERADIVAMTSNAAIAEAVQTKGYLVRGVDGERTIRGSVVTSLSDDVDPFDWIILATQPPQVEEAARQAMPWLAKTGAMVCLQNGLCEERVAKIVGPDRVVGAVVAWGASMNEPGVYERTSAGGFTVGRMDGADDERLLRLALMLEAVGPVTTTSNLAGARWSKLAINCAISTLGTLAADRLGPLMVHRHIRRLALEIMTEVVKVAHAEKVKLEKVSGTIDLDWIALTDEEKKAAIGSPGLFAKHSMLLAVGARYRRMRSSMLAAIERGRPPAVDYLNGEVVDRGAKHGIDTPVNRECQRLVHSLARKELTPGLALTRQVAKQFGIG